VTKFKTILLATLGVVMAGAAAAPSFAQTPVEAAHPRRAEVAHRIAAQQHRIRVARVEGLISPKKAAYLHRQEGITRDEARLDAERHHGRITRHEQVALNHRENKVNRELAR
jgi:dihydrodipicolinate synthase/N-acetylneuraminate lyase